MAAVSPYFKVMFKSPVQDISEQGQADLSFLDGEHVEKIIDYCYTGKLTLYLDTVAKCLEIMDYLQLNILKSDIENFVCENLTSKNCIGWFFYAEKYNLSLLKKQSRSLMTKEFKEVTKYQEFLELSVCELLDYIDEVVTGCLGDDVIDAAFEWMTYDVRLRSSEFLDVINHLQLDKCTEEGLQRMLTSYKLAWPNYEEIKTILSTHIASIKDKNKNQGTDVPVVYAHSGYIRVQLVEPISEIIVLGGGTSKNQLNRKMWKLDVLSGSLEFLGNISHHAAKYWAGYCKTVKGILAVGGSRSSKDFHETPTDVCHYLHCSSYTWQSLPDIPLPVESISMIHVYGDVYVFGISGDLTSVFGLDLLNRMWFGHTDTLQHCHRPILAAIGHKIYIIFNTSIRNQKYQENDTVTVQCYDTVTQSCTFKRPLPVQLKNTWGSCAVTIGSQIYLVGGKGRICASYCPHQDKWQNLKKPRSVHKYGSAVHIDGIIYLCGGVDENEEPTNLIEAYNILQNTWRTHHVRLPVPLWLHFCSVLDQ